MKMFVGILVFVMGVVSSAVAQPSVNIKTCRAHRDAWMASQKFDMQHLRVEQLVERSDEMVTCMTQVDSNLQENTETSNMTLEVIQRAEYQTLALLYYREAFSRISSYLDSKNLLQDFKRRDRQWSSQSR